MSDVQRVPFDIGSLDLCSGGGWPVGRSTLVYGKPRTGKTTTALYILRAYQQADNRMAVIYDEEDKWSSERAEQIGIDMSRVQVEPPGFCIEDLDAILMLVRERKDVGFCLVDSLREMPVEQRLEESKKRDPSIGDVYVGAEATVLNQFYDHLPRYQRRRRDAGSPFSFVGINHESVSIQTIGGRQIQSIVIPGGRVQRYGSYLRVRFHTSEYAKEMTVNGISFAPKLQVKFTVEANSGKVASGKFWLFQAGPRTGEVDQEGQFLTWGQASGFIGGGGTNWVVGERNGFRNHQAITDDWLSNREQYTKDRREITRLMLDVIKNES